MYAYILVKTDEGKEKSIYDKLFDFKEVIGAHITFGEWDLLIKVEIEGNEALGTFMIDNLRPMQGITITSTLIVAR